MDGWMDDGMLDVKALSRIAKKSTVGAGWMDEWAGGCKSRF